MYIVQQFPGDEGRQGRGGEEGEQQPQELCEAAGGGEEEAGEGEGKDDLKC